MDGLLAMPPCGAKPSSIAPRLLCSRLCYAPTPCCCCDVYTPQVVNRYIDQGVAELVPGVLFIDEVRGYWEGPLAAE